MVMRREAKPEAVTHEAIMDRLELGNARFDDIDLRFDRIDQQLKPFAHIIEEAGGEEDFTKLVGEGVDALKAIAWFGRLARRGLVLVTVVGGAVTAVTAMIKVFFWDFGKGG